jgi:hypothetical protein
LLTSVFDSCDQAASELPKPFAMLTFGDLAYCLDGAASDFGNRSHGADEYDIAPE